jgi:glucose-6-phosphate 1-dehydrogenase
MDQPVSAHPDDIRDEKCKVLRCIPPVTLEVRFFVFEGDVMIYCIDHVARFLV